MCRVRAGPVRSLATLSLYLHLIPACSCPAFLVLAFKLFGLYRELCPEPYDPNVGRLIRAGPSESLVGRSQAAARWHHRTVTRARDPFPPLDGFFAHFGRGRLLQIACARARAAVRAADRSRCSSGARTGNRTRAPLRKHGLAIALEQLVTLNPSQITAVLKAVFQPSGVSLIQGPPGTGKTTSVLLLSVLLASSPTTQVLLHYVQADSMSANRNIRVGGALMWTVFDLD